jgi:hypothetical protein
MWFKVDDNLAFHRKTLRAGNTAMGMWVRAGSECSSQLTDGYVADELVSALGGKKLAERLVDASLWVRVDGGYQFHEWNEEGRQPTRAQVEEERKQARLRKAMWRESRKASREASQRDTAGTDSGTDSGTDTTVPAGVPPTPTRPDPTRPDPDSLKGVSSEEKRGKRRTTIPEDWTPTERDVEWQREKNITDDYACRQLEQFRLYWTSNGDPKADWSATWRNWLLRAPSFERPGTNGRPAAGGVDPVTSKAKGPGWQFGMDQ